jgi:superkiller protein 3
MSPDEPDLLDDEAPKGWSLGWPIILGIVAALGIIGILGYQFVSQRPASEAVEGDNGSTQAEVATAEEQFKLGNTLYETGRLDEAIVAYQKAIELDPTYQAAYANLGVAYYQQQQFDLAAAQYEKALELKPDDGEVTYNLGVLYLQQALSEGTGSSLLNKAITQLQQAKDMSPHLAEPHFSLGVAYMASGQNQEAIQAFETYLSLASNQDARAKQEAEQYLQRLRGQ